MADTDKSYSIEYYQSFAGYDLPLRLIGKTTKEEAEAKAEDAAYYIGYFDATRKLIKVVKILRGGVVFEHAYFYYPNGKLKRKEGKDEYGTSTVQEFDEAGNLKKSTK